jgi:light-regulated signal transduction histidine kinase (bacteriophytochrome)
MQIVPYFDLATEKINDGEVYTSHKFCSKELSEKCRSFYKAIDGPGFYTCPFGYTTFATNFGLANKILYTSLLVQSNYDKKKLKARGEEKNKFQLDEITRLIGIYEQLSKRTKSSEEDSAYATSLIRDVFHEVRRLSRDISSQSMELVKRFKDDEKAAAKLDTTLATLQLLSIRVDSYELYKNPGAITSATQPNIAIYKKFDKARFILASQAKAKKVNINFINQSHFSINGYEIFDLLPYVILDNAVKYSAKKQDVDVYFDSTEKTVTIKNLGPQISKEDLPSIFKHGYRAKNAKAFEGSGLGLYLAKQIADLHRIKVYTDSKENSDFTLDGIPYSEFSISLTFK